MNETIPDKEAYQTNRRRMCWAALGMMIACTAATIYDTARKSEAESILIAQYLALSCLVGAYFAGREVVIGLIIGSPRNLIYGYFMPTNQSEKSKI
jgi:hypothetical protein